MNVVERWFEKASRLVNVHKDFEGEFLIYRGFKISKENGVFRIQDVRHSEFYSPVLSHEYAMMVEKGFIATCDILSYENNIERIEDYRVTIEALELKKKLAKKSLKSNKKLNLKRIRLAEENIVELKNLIQLTESRIKQFKIKYSKNE